MRRGTGPAARARRAVVAAGALVVIASACTGRSHPSPTPTTPRLETGGTLRVGLVSVGGRDYDPQVYSGTPVFEEIGTCCLLRTLLSYNGQDTSHGGTTLHPDLAASLPVVSADGLTWTFHLRRGIRYAPPLQHTEIVAQDFVRAIEREIAPAPRYLSFFGGLMGDSGGASLTFASIIQGGKEYSRGTSESIAGLEAPNPHTFVVHLTAPNGDIGYEFATPETAPIPANPYDPGARFGVADGHDGDYGNYLVASGPYMIEGSEKLDFRLPPIRQAPAAGVRPDSVTLVRNPSWDRSGDLLRLASPDRIVLTAVDADQATAQIDAGTIDVAIDSDASPDAIARYQADPASRHRVYQTAGDSLLFLSLNLAVPPLDDLHVRRAMAYAVDKEAALRAFEKHRGQLAAVATHLVPDSLEHNLLFTYDPYGPGHSGNVTLARSEMSQSSYDRNHDGVCDTAACGSVRILVKDEPERVAIARILRADLAPIGIHLRVDVVDPGTFFFSTGDPASRIALVLFEASRGLPAAADFIGNFKSPRHGAFNYTTIGASPAFLRKYGYTVTHVPSVDDRIRACVPLTFQAQTECWAVLDQYLTEQVVPWIPLVATTVPRIVSTRVRALSFDQANPGVPMPALDRIVLTSAAVRQPPSAEPTSPALSGGPSAIPDGTYTVTVSRRDLIHAGVATDDDFDLTQDSGTYTLTLAGGRWRMTLTSPEVWFAPVETGTYAGSGDRVTLLTQTPQIDAVALSMRWQVIGSALRFDLQAVAPKDRVPSQILDGIFGSHVWERSG